MKDIALIAPYVRPDAPTCPMPLMVQRIRLAAVEFCRRTSVLMPTLNLLTVAEQATYEVGLAQHEVLKLTSVSIDGSDVNIPARAELQDKQSSGDTSQFAWIDGDTLHLNNAPTMDDQKLVVVLVRIPTLDCAQIDDRLVDQHGEDIGFGALARLHGMPEKDWTNPAAEMRNEGKFNARCAKVANRQARANSSGRTRTKAHWF